ncbi:MAG: glucose 1-dehydrogenase [Pseudomonadota bacterium]
MELTGKTAIVTGAGQGIGAATARALADAGASVLVVDKIAEKAERAAAELSETGAQTVALTADVTVAADNKRMADAAIDQLGGLDIFVSCAGIYPDKALLEMDLDFWSGVLALNLTGSFLGAQACAKKMAERGGGRIVLTSSITGNRVGMGGLSAYAASKAGVNGFIKSAAIELAEYDIRINAVEPGMVRTEGLLAFGEEFLDTLGSENPFKRIARPEEIASVIAFLASDASAFVTGQTIVIDGGQTLPEVPYALVGRPETS